MKKLHFYLTILCYLTLLSCDKMSINPPMIFDEMELDENNMENILLSGNFMAAAHPTSGKAEIIDDNGVKKLRFTNFKTDSGPDLRVYLAEDQNAKNFIEVSKKVENGNLIYQIPDAADLENQTYVLIWCKLFGVNFGSAKLTMP